MMKSMRYDAVGHSGDTLIGRPMRQLGWNASGTAAKSSSQPDRDRDRILELKERIEKFSSYGEDWDGDGAREIPDKAVQDALRFLDAFTHRSGAKEPCAAAPGPDGEVVLYWHDSAGYAEVNFDGNGRLTMCWCNDANEMDAIEADAKSIAESDTNSVWDILSEFWSHRRQ